MFVCSTKFSSSLQGFLSHKGAIQGDQLASTMLGSLSKWHRVRKWCAVFRKLLFFTTSWCPSRHWDSSYPFLFVFTQGLEHKVPDCAGFWCVNHVVLTMWWSRYPYEFSTWSWPLTQDPFRWTLLLLSKHMIASNFNSSFLAFKLVFIAVIDYDNKGLP